MFEAIAALVALLVAAVGWGLAERWRANVAGERAALAAAQGVLDGKRVRVAADRKEAAEVAAAVHRAAVTAAEGAHADKVAAIAVVEAELARADDAEAAAALLRGD